MSSARDGYIALLSILIVAAISASTVLILFITSVTSTLNTRDVLAARYAKVLAEACAEAALQRLSSWNPNPSCACTGAPNCTGDGSCPAPITESYGSCRIVSIAGTDDPNPPDAVNFWTLRTTGTANAFQLGLTKYLELRAERTAPGAPATVTSWKECLNLAAVPPTPCLTP